MRFTVVIFPILWLVFINAQVSSAVDAGLCDGSYCIQQYVKGFVDAAKNTWSIYGYFYDTSFEDINLHCRLDFELAACTSSALQSCGSSKTLVSLGRAVLSYMVYDDKLRVCPHHMKWDYYKLLDQQLKLNDNDDTLAWKEKIQTLSSAYYSFCAEKVDRSCIIEFVSKMKTSPDLCTNIPFKSQCLSEHNQECPASITKALLDVFPEEANNVLAALCP